MFVSHIVPGSKLNSLRNVIPPKKKWEFRSDPIAGTLWLYVLLEKFLHPETTYGGGNPER